MNPLLDLRRHLAPALTRTSGEIVEALGANRYRVRLRSGAVEAVAVGNAAFVVGAEVMVRDGVILGRVKSSAAVKVYSV